jgi:hypothetical protein
MESGRLKTRLEACGYEGRLRGLGIYMRIER